MPFSTPQTARHVFVHERVEEPYRPTGRAQQLPRRPGRARRAAQGAALAGVGCAHGTSRGSRPRRAPWPPRHRPPTSPQTRRPSPPPPSTRPRRRPPRRSSPAMPSSTGMAVFSEAGHRRRPRRHIREDMVRIGRSGIGSSELACDCMMRRMDPRGFSTSDAVGTCM